MNRIKFEDIVSLAKDGTLNSEKQKNNPLVKMLAQGSKNLAEYVLKNNKSIFRALKFFIFI